MSSADNTRRLEGDVEVTLGDQKLINRFARLNAKCEELEADLSAAERRLENSSEALDELALEDESVWIRSGEVFARMTSDGAQQWIEGLRRELESATKGIRESLATMRAEMTTIKATLYAKFGNNINLEYDDDDEAVERRKALRRSAILGVTLALESKHKNSSILLTQFFQSLSLSLIHCQRKPNTKQSAGDERKAEHREDREEDVDNPFSLSIRAFSQSLATFAAETQAVAKASILCSFRASCPPKRSFGEFLSALLVERKGRKGCRRPSQH
ncbi:unnamed protein product [Oppiella nova]|uniref:Uncharacterized protein n=1 Tax=Oppiella nova TaxID=334625 RepID=A0A7R9LTP7_9ACAR|nr:unnamed protein product [Oppiella nova]CAG2166567.1 unnamed protein product [Oppiella nova]